MKMKETERLEKNKHMFHAYSPTEWPYLNGYVCGNGNDTRETMEFVAL
jgi:hypothetical protein